MWCASSYKLVSQLLRDKQFTRTDPLADSDSQPEHLADFYKVEKYSLLNLEPPQHTRLRSLLNHAFISRQVNELGPQIKQCAEQLLASLPHQGRHDLLPEYAMPLPAQIIARMLGVPDARIPSLLDWSHAMVKVYTLTQSREDEIAANQAAKAFAALLQSLISERRLRPENDLLTHLTKAAQGSNSEGLSDEEIISTAVLLLNAGHEATVHQSGNAVKTILESGLDPQKLFATPEQTSNTVQELMRYDAPLHLFIRYATDNVILDGVDIKRGEQVALLLGAANRDPSRFVDADKFDPWREDAGHLSLGAGLHYCVGAQLAKLELEISLPLLFQTLQGLRFTETPPVYKNAFHFHGLETLELEWDANALA